MDTSKKYYLFMPEFFPVLVNILKYCCFVKNVLISDFKTFGSKKLDFCSDIYISGKLE